MDILGRIQFLDATLDLPRFTPHQAQFNTFPAWIQDALKTSLNLHNSNIDSHARLANQLAAFNKHKNSNTLPHHLTQATPLPTLQINKTDDDNDNNTLERIRTAHDRYQQTLFQILGDNKHLALQRASTSITPQSLPQTLRSNLLKNMVPLALEEPRLDGLMPVIVKAFQYAVWSAQTRTETLRYDNFKKEQRKVAATETKTTAEDVLMASTTEAANIARTSIEQMIEEKMKRVHQLVASQLKSSPKNDKRLTFTNKRSTPTKSQSKSTRPTSKVKGVKPTAKPPRQPPTKGRGNGRRK